MEPAPLPPHERAWRHPSELGPPPHEPTSTSGKALIVTSAALGLMIVGVLAVAMTPNRAASPTAVASTVTLGRPVVLGVSQSVPRVPALSPWSSRQGATAALRTVVTPLGDAGMGVTTLHAVAGRSGVLTARLPTGEVVNVVVIRTDEASGLALVALSGSVSRPGYRMADEPPAPDDTVLVHGVEPIVVAMVELAELEVDEGTPVLDSDGDLVGLCSDSGRGTELLTMADRTDVDEDEDGGTTPATTVRASPPTAATTVEDGWDDGAGDRDGAESTLLSPDGGASEPGD